MKKFIFVLLFLCLSSVSWATQDISFTYDRLGRVKTVTDAVGTREFKYNNALKLESETIAGIYNTAIGRHYETSPVKGRYEGVSIGSSNEYRVTYGYCPTTGRLNSVAWMVGGDRIGQVNYTYLPNSDLIEQMKFQPVIGVVYMGNDDLQVTYSYEAYRNLKTQVKNQYSETVISMFDCQYDALGRMEHVTISGTAYQSNEGFNTFNYNDRSELTDFNRYLGMNPEDLNSPVPEEARNYGYDLIGNRTNITEGATSGTYTPNNLNQYASLEFGSNTTNFVHDADGNLTEIIGDNNVKYIWNGENRLIHVEPSNAPVAGDKRVGFMYDYKGRRVKRVVYTCQLDDTWPLNPDVETLYIYDDWNLIQEITTAGDTTSSRYFIWGLDLSLSLKEAGGVGGLIAIIDGDKTYYPLYDANGNIWTLIDKSDGSVEAAYRYDPYGKVISATGDYASDNPFRFSTKYQDDDTGLIYYGYRDYSPAHGRWTSRDPIEENGGLNLYGFVNNSPINIYDSFGLDFIALAARPLALGIPGNDGAHAVNFLLNHLSIEYWESTCPAGEGTEYFSEDFMNTHNAERIDSFQLMQDEDNIWVSWRRNNRIYGPQWSTEIAKVSVIVYNNSSTANRFAAFYEPAEDNEVQVQNMWDSLIGRAQQYPFAEQSDPTGIFRGNFRNWPNSKYFFPWEPPGNNSNSFARWIVRESGQNIPQLFGEFPGREFPVNVTNNRDWSIPQSEEWSEPVFQGRR